MKSSRKKWILFSVFLVFIGLGSAFLLKLNSVSETPAVAAKARPAPVPPENLEHELKELGVQLQKRPGHTPVLMRMAQIEREKGKLDDAATHLREVVHNEPENADAHLELGRNLYEKGDLNGGISETETVLKINPKQVDALYNLGAIYANLGNTERARLYWTRAVQADANAESGRKAREALTKIGGI